MARKRKAPVEAEESGMVTTVEQMKLFDDEPEGWKPIQAAGRRVMKAEREIKAWVTKLNRAKEDLQTAVDDAKIKKKDGGIAFQYDTMQIRIKPSHERVSVRIVKDDAPKSKPKAKGKGKAAGAAGAKKRGPGRPKKVDVAEAAREAGEKTGDEA